MQTQDRGKELASIIKLVTPEQLVHVLECIEDGIFVTDDDGKVIYINESAAQILQQPREVLLGKDIWHEFPKLVNSKPHLEWNRVARERSDSRFKSLMPIICQWMDMMMYYCDDVGVITVMRNIHEWTTSEERSQVLRDLMESLAAAITLEQVTHTILEKGLSLLKGNLGVVALINPDGQTLRLLSNTVSAVEIPAEMPLTQPSAITDTINAREPVFIESAADYAVRYPEFANFPIKGAEGMAVAAMPLIVQERLLGALAISMPRDRKLDLGERDFFTALAHQCAQAIDRALLYETESEARRAAERANTMRMQFVGMLSHELRTPLTTIKGFATTLLAPDVTWERESQEEFLGIIGYEAERLAELVDDLLELSRIDSGHFKVSPQKIGLHQVLSDAMPAMITLSTDHKLTIDVSVALPEVLADNKRTGQVLINLVSNAAKHSAPETEITIRAQQMDGMVQVDVSDQGTGIPAEIRETIFEPFQQGSEIEGSRVDGAGLGLTIAKAIIEAQGGRIWVQDQVKGTTVSFTVPTVG